MLRSVLLLALLVSTSILHAQVSFIQNRGQVADQHQQPRTDVLFSGEAGNLAFHLRKDGISYQSLRVNRWAEADQNLPDPGPIAEEVTVYRTDVQWLGTNPNCEIISVGETDNYSNYYLEGCPDGITNVPTYREVRYQNLYANIDLRWYSYEGALKYDFELAAGADYQQIQWNVAGATNLYVDERGQLVMETPQGTLVEKAPLVTQNGKRIDASWSVSGSTVGFDIPNVDPQQALVIDPLVLLQDWGTHFGGTGQDHGMTIARDATQGLIYMSGTSNSLANIATTGAHQQTFGGGIWEGDGFVSCFNEQGVLQWSTYFGGSGTEVVWSSALTTTHELLVTGYTASSNAIATSNVHQNNYGGGNDGFLVKFNNQGVRVWGTYYGGNQMDGAMGVTTDSQDNIYLAGFTKSLSGITTPGTFSPNYLNLNPNDFYLIGFVAKFNASGVRQWGTHISIANFNSWDYVHHLATDSDDNLYLTGGTMIVDDLATPNSHQATIGGGIDAMLMKFSPSGQRIWGTFLGGTGDDRGWQVSIDDQDNVFVAGETQSAQQIASAGSHLDTLPGNGWARATFINSFDTSGVRQWGSYFAGPGDEDRPFCLAEGNGKAYLSGSTSSGFGLIDPGTYQDQMQGSGDGFIAHFTAQGQVDWSTYVGGDSTDYINGLALGNAGEIYLVAGGNSAAGISTPMSHQPQPGGQTDAYLLKLSPCPVPQTVLNPLACMSYTSPAGQVLTSSGTYYDTLSTTLGCDSILTINLTIDSTSTNSITVNACDQFTAPSGAMYTTSGSFIDMLTAQSGCDSILTINLTVTHLNATAAYQAPYLTSPTSGTTYEWIRCEDSTTILISSNDTLLPTFDGSFAVIVTQNGCIDTSSCIQVLGTGLEESAFGADFSCFPNPTSGLVTVDLGANHSGWLYLRDVQGRLLQSQRFQNASTFPMDLQVPAGLYILEVLTDTGISSQTRIAKH